MMSPKIKTTFSDKDTLGSPCCMHESRRESKGGREYEREGEYEGEGEW